jgi:hypothetical protein
MQVDVVEHVQFLEPFVNAFKPDHGLPPPRVPGGSSAHDIPASFRGRQRITHFEQIINK